VTHPARDIEFTYGAFGKPALVGGGGQFNLSHSGELVVIAVSALSPVGVDVEQVDRSVDFDGVVGSLGSAGERVAFAALPTEDRRLAFFRWWTRKEAVMKALGTGLSLAPESFEVSITTDDARVKSAEFPQSVSLSNLSLADGYIGSLAVCGELRSVQLREFGGFGLGGSG
jgi:4'-phosphopantetheinyl transferase